MRYGISLVGLLLVILTACAEKQEVENAKVRLVLDPDGPQEMTFSIEGITAACMSSQDKSAVFFSVSSRSDQVAVCDFHCEFFDPRRNEETFALACENVSISPNAPRAAYCRRSVEGLTQGLGMIRRFKFECEEPAAQ